MIRINGIQREWNESNEFFKMMSTSCYVYENLKGLNCSPWVPSQDNSFIQAGEALVQEKVEYTSNLAIGVNLIQKGKVIFYL